MTAVTSDSDPDGRVAVALAALAEVTDPADVGPLIEVEELEQGVVDLRFASALAGYVDWRWTVSTAIVEGSGPTVLELGLLPGAGSLVAPPWVPWAERLAEWRKAHPHDAAPGDAGDDEDGLDTDDQDDEQDDELDAEELDAEDDELDADDDLDADGIDDDVLDDDVLDDEVDVEDDDDDEDGRDGEPDSR